MAEFHIWEGVYPSFAEAKAEGPGFAGDTWRQRSSDQFNEALAQLAGTGTVPAFVHDREYLLPAVTASLLCLQERVRVLDFGGGLGTGWLALCAALGKATAQVDFDIVEVPNICAAGPALYEGGLQGPSFTPDLPSQPGCYDIVHAGSVMQYVEDWRGVVAALAALQAPVLLLSDIFAGPNPAFATLQNYYGSRIPHWFLNDGEFIAAVEACGYRLTARTAYESRLLGRVGPLPMDNFPADRRLAHTCHLIFSRIGRD